MSLRCYDNKGLFEGNIVYLRPRYAICSPSAARMTLQAPKVISLSLSSIYSAKLTKYPKQSGDVLPMFFWQVCIVKVVVKQLEHWRGKIP